MVVMVLVWEERNSKAWAYLEENSLTLFYGEDAVQVDDNPFAFPKFKSGCILELKISNKLLSC